MKHKVNPCLVPNSTLGIDEACLTVINQNNATVTLYGMPDECYVCNGQPWGQIPAHSNVTFPINTKYPTHLYYTNPLEVCHGTYDFKEHGRYGWNLTTGGCSEFYTLQEPYNSYLPLLAAVMVYTFIAVAWSSTMFIVKVVKDHFSQEIVSTPDDLSRIQESSISPSQQSIIRTNKTSTRIQSIDAFRGISILLMIFVNNGGGKYVIFNHTAWNGITIADLVLPWFAWIMGLTITISKRAELRVSNSRGRIVYQCFLRSLRLIALGLMLNSKRYGDLNELRFPGVLQLLAVGYFFCATLETMFMKQYIQSEGTLLRDILTSWVQWVIIAIVISVHTGITFLFPVPGCPKGYLGPGGYHLRGKYENCTAGAAGYIDRLIFGSHIYNHTDNPVYGKILPHDPEGLMNSISAILIVYLGVHAGKILLSYYQCNARVTRWLLWSAITGLIGGFLCDFKREGGLIPVNKNMMTLSFVLLTSSLAFLLFSILYLIIDYKRIWSGRPFTYAGINPIFLYVGHYITQGLFPWAWNIWPLHSHGPILAMNLWTTTLWGIIAYTLYTKDMIFTV